MSNPDLSLIGPLTKLLHVSADELLGLTSENNAPQRRAIEAQYRETWQTGDLTQRYTVACTAVSQYPGEMRYLDWLAWCEGMRSFVLSDDKERIAEQEKAIKHFSCVIENAQDEKIKASSVQGIVQYLCARGRYEEAKKYAELYPDHYSVSRDDLLLECLQGEEKARHAQNMLDRMLTDILNQIGNHDMFACEAQEKILNALIPDQNYLYYHCFLADNYRRRARLYVSSGQNEAAVACLQKSLEYALAYDKFISETKTYRFTSPFFNQVEYNTADICRTEAATQVDDFYKAIEQPCFNPLRNRDDFAALCPMM